MYLEGRVNSAYSQLTDAETKLKDLKTSDKSSMGEIEDKNRELRRKYDRYFFPTIHYSLLSSLTQDIAVAAATALAVTPGCCARGLHVGGAGKETERRAM